MRDPIFSLWFNRSQGGKLVAINPKLEEVRGDWYMYFYGTLGAVLDQVRNYDLLMKTWGKGKDKCTAVDIVKAAKAFCTKNLQRNFNKRIEGALPKNRRVYQLYFDRKDWLMSVNPDFHSISPNQICACFGTIEEIKNQIQARREYVKNSSEYINNQANREIIEKVGLWLEDIKLKRCATSLLKKEKANCDNCDWHETICTEPIYGRCYAPLPSWIEKSVKHGRERKEISNQLGCPLWKPHEHEKDAAVDGESTSINEKRVIPVVFRGGNKVGWTATTPVLKGCVGDGDTKKEAFEDFQAALCALLDAYRQEKKPVPWQEPVLESIDDMWLVAVDDSADFVKGKK